MATEDTQTSFLLNLGRHLGAHANKHHYGNNHSIGWWWEDRELLGRPFIATGEAGTPELRVTWDGAKARGTTTTHHIPPMLGPLLAELAETAQQWH